MINRQYAKKGLVLLMVLVLGIMVLAGCGKSSPKNEMKPSETETPIQAEKESDEPVKEEASKTENLPSENADTETENTNNILVVYFTATGHTKPLAEYAAEYLSADIYEIVPETAYSDEDLDYNDSSSRSSIEQNDDYARPAILGTLPDISGYDTIIIGHPIWWGQAPKIIYTFLENYDWSGKTLVTFCTSASSGLGNSADNLKPSALGNPNWLESRRFPIGADREDVIEWLCACQIK